VTIAEDDACMKNIT